ncbi:hypothetical protein [Aeromicrobium sp. CF3.5]|uniref:hypothetical protein n=1 Tax=Aeromicrobium sp. CF3.5 TaxID=3373078 RepID=UPI003EE53DDC
MALVGLYAQIARTAVAPRTPWDENGPLQMARILAGQDNVTQMSGSGYYPGWSFLLAPLWLISDDPEIVYRGAVVFGIVVSLATVWPLAVLGRQLGLSTAQAVTVGAITMALPARAVLVDYALSEALLTFLLAWTVVAVFRFSTRPSVPMAMVVAVLASATYLTHARALALFATAALWFLLVAIRRPLPAFVGLATLAAGYLGVQFAVSRITQPVLLAGFGKEELLSDAVSSTTPALLLQVVLNQTWVQLVGTFGLFALGTAIILPRVWVEVRQVRTGPWTFVLGTVVSAMLASFLWWAGPRFLLGSDQRFDVWVYSRYIDPVAAIVVVIAAAALIRGMSRRTVVAAAAGAAAICIPVVLYVAPNVPVWGSTFGPGNAGAVLAWARFWPEEPFERPLVPTLTNANHFWLLASIFLMGCFIAFLLLRRHPLAAAVLALPAVVLASLAADPDQPRDAPYALLDSIERVEDALPSDGMQTIDVDTSCKGPALTSAQVTNWSGFWFSPRDVEIIDSSTDALDSDLIVACADWPKAAQLGAERVVGDDFYSHGLWVLPGQLQDQLTAVDLTVPSGP